MTKKSISKLIYKICSRHDIAEILQKLTLNTNQSFNRKGQLYIYICKEKKVIVLFLRQKVVKCFSQLGQNRISGVMVSVLTWSAVDHGFKPRSGQTKDYKIDMCCFSAKHVALRRKGNDWLARNQNIMTEWSDMSTSRLFFH